MVRLEIRAYYTRGIGYVAKQDEKCSVPVRDVTEEEAKAFQDLLEKMGARRHETRSQIFYDLIEDSNHSREYIFYK